jgi:ferredoxin
MKAKVDPNLCIGCGICEQVCPAVFKMNDEGIAVAIEGEIDTMWEEDTVSAKEQCPVEAITT